MSAEVIIGIDAGTSVIKAVAFDLQGRQLAIASTPNQVLFGPRGAAEQDMDATWTAACLTLRALAEQLPDLASRAVALAATGQGDGTWLIDAEGRPVGPAMLWLDGRAAPQVAALRAGPAAQDIALRTGTALNPSMQSVQMAWLRDTQPDRLAHAHTAMHCKDWLYFCATGERCTTLCEGIFTYGNQRTNEYDDAVIEWLGLGRQRHLLPPMIEGVRGAMPLTERAAGQTGLRAGLPVVMPPMDVPATLLGGGAVSFGARVGCSILGSTGMHGWVCEGMDAIHPSAEAGYTMTMPLPDHRARLMSHMAATLNIDWLLGLMEQVTALSDASPLPRARLLERLNRLVLEAAPAQALFHPYVADNGERGPFVDVNARAQLSGFNSSLGLGGMARAVFEGIVLAARDCYAALGPLPDEIRLSGGAAKSPALRQLLADVTQRPVRVSHREECGAAGAAMVAAVAIGQASSLREALPVWVDAFLDANVTAPDPARAALYDTLFPIYRDVAQRARAPWAALADVRRQRRQTSTDKGTA